MTTALTAIGTGVSVFSSISGGIAESRAAQFRAQIAEKNRAIAEENARRAIDTSQVEQQDQDLTALVLMGEQQAGQGASGLSYGSKSFALTRSATSALARRDAARIIEGGQLEARNYRQQASDFANEASLERASAKSSLLQGFLGGASSLVSGAAKIRSGAQYSNPAFESLLGKRRAVRAGGIGHA